MNWMDVEIEESTLMKNFMTGFIVVTLFIVILATVLIMVKGQDFIDPGYCFIGNISNETYSVCSNNCSAVNTTYINFTLGPGQSYSNTSGSCNVSGFCSQANTTACTYNTTSPGKCIITGQHIHPNTTFDLVNDECDIEIQCKDYSEYLENTTLTYTEKLEVRYSNNIVTVNFRGKDITIPTGSGSSYTDYLTYTCPDMTLHTMTDNQAVAVSYEQCKEIVPLYCSEVTALLMTQNNEFRAQLTECQGNLDNNQLDLLRIKERNICIPNDQYVDFQIKNQQLTNESEQCSFLSGMRAKEIIDKDYFIYELGFFAIVQAGIIAYLIYHPRQAKKQSAVV